MLKYEIGAYALVALLGILGLFATRARGLAVLSVLGAAYLAVTLLTDWRSESVILDSTMRLGAYFFLGSAFYLFRDKIELSLRLGILIALVAALSYGTALFDVTSKVALAYVVFWVALVPKGIIRLFNRLGDYSYGLYIFTWPMQQIAAQIFPDLTPHFLFITVFPVALIAAAVSWHYLEEPCLQRRGAILTATNRLFIFTQRQLAGKALRQT